MMFLCLILFSYAYLNVVFLVKSEMNDYVIQYLLFGLYLYISAILGCAFTSTALLSPYRIILQLIS